MTLRLTIDTERWRAQLDEFNDRVHGLIPVVKGNGYGFGFDLLAAEAKRLGVQTLAVGIAREVAEARACGWDEDIVVLNPWRPSDPVATALLDDKRVITTVSRAEDLRQLSVEHPTARVIVELETSMHRHGLDPRELSAGDFGVLWFEGWTIHLPAAGSRAEATELAKAGIAARSGPVWVSHLSVDDYRRFSLDIGVPTYLRVGTRLWQGDRTAYRTTATVLDVHSIRKGEVLGYHGVPAPKDGFIVVASGGTAHGVAMAAPVPQRTLKQRGVTVAEGILEAVGRTLSPYTIGGKKRSFAEPPHMQSSMLFVPGPDPLVEVGDELPVTTRMTTVVTDDVRWA